jgi:hypothetical protein
MKRGVILASMDSMFEGREARASTHSRFGLIVTYEYDGPVASGLTP